MQEEAKTKYNDPAEKGVKINAFRIYENQFEIFEEEFSEIGNYVSFTKNNLGVYSNKIHELHLRICSEVENLIKMVIHKHFVQEDEIKKRWEQEKAKRLTQKNVVKEYETLFKKLNRDEKKDLDKRLFGFPDFPFYFGIACQEFNLDKKMVKFSRALDDSEEMNLIQPCEIYDKEVSPTWFSKYNKLKHDRVTHFELCNFGDLIKAFGAMYILMNYFKSYSAGNSPTYDHKYWLDNPATRTYSFKCDFIEFKSKFFGYTLTTQPNFANVLKTILPRNITREVYLDYTSKVDFQDRGEVSFIGEFTQKQKKSSLSEYCIFHTYFDYVESGEDLMDLRFFAVFNN
jgi:hypothetical protein